MSTEKLIVELNAKTDDLDRALKSIEQKLDRLDKKTESTSDSFDDLSKTSKKAGDEISGSLGAASKSSEGLGESLKGTGDKLDDLDKKTESASDAFIDFSKSSKKASDDLSEAAKSMSNATDDALKFGEQLEESNKQNAESTKALADSLERALTKVNKKSKESTGALSKIGGAAKSAGRGIGKVGSIAKSSALALAGMQAALVGVAKVASEQAKEIKNVAEVTGVSVESMQALGAAANSVGISMEQIGDQSKDTKEKIGEFLATGGGGFQDFADVMGLTADEAKKAAEEFRGLSGPEVLQKMVSEMEAGGVSADKMSFALEGMASDTTKLLPLLRDGGAELDSLKEKFYETNVVLSETDIEKLGEMEGNFKSLGDTFNATMGKFSVEYADQINGMIATTQEGLKIVGDEFASGAFTDRLNSFYSAFTGSWADAFGDNIEITDEFSGDASELIKDMAKAFLDFTLTLPINMKIAGLAVKELFMDIVDEIVLALGELNLKIQEGLSLIGQGDVEGAQIELGFIKEQIKARDEQADAEIEALQRMKEARLAAFEEEQEQATIKREQYAADTTARLVAAEKEQEQLRKIRSQEQKAEVKTNKEKEKQNKIEDKVVKNKAKTNEELIKGGLALAEAAFKDNKEISAAIAFINTAEGVTEALSKQDYVGAAITAATGAVQISNILSTEKGGGSSVGSVPSAPPQQPDFQPDTTDLQLSDATGGGSQNINLNISTDSGDELIDAIANALNKGQAEGRF